MSYDLRKGEIPCYCMNITIQISMWVILSGRNKTIFDSKLKFFSVMKHLEAREWSLQREGLPRNL